MNLSPNSQVCTKKFEFVPETTTDFLDLFPHRAAYIWADHPSPGERSEWRTENRHMLSDRLILQGAYLYGVRFGDSTNYLMIDIDAGSIYHPSRDPHAISRILEAIEPLGFTRYLAVSSSYSGGIHLYFPFIMGQNSWKLGNAIELLLERRGLKVVNGHLELFPNARRRGGADFNAHRLPMQAGSYLLNEDFQPIFGSYGEFVDRWRLIQGSNAPRAEAIDQILRQYRRRQYRRLGVSAQKFLNDLNAEIEPGWTGFGQTNRLLGRIAVREYVFHHALYGGSPLTGANLQWRIYNVATALPGYEQFCRHQAEILHLVLEWANAVESSHYYHFGGKKPLETVQDAPEPTWNQQQSSNARERIRRAVAELQSRGEWPDRVRERAAALRFEGRVGTDALYKNKDLWHPEILRKSLEAAPAGLIPPTAPKPDDPRSLEAAPAGLIPPIGPNKLMAQFSAAPQARAEISTDKTAVGGSGGLSTGEQMPDAPPLPDAPPPAASAADIAAIIQRLKRTAPARITPLPGEIPPDERLFQQLNLSLWRRA